MSNQAKKLNTVNFLNLKHWKEIKVNTSFSNFGQEETSQKSFLNSGCNWRPVL